MTEALVEAICDNKINDVAQLLCCGANPNGIIDEDALTPLHFAVTFDAIESILLLLVAGADMFQENEEGESAISKAIELKKYQAVRIFLFF